MLSFFTTNFYEKSFIFSYNEKDLLSVTYFLNEFLNLSSKGLHCLSLIDKTSI